MKTRTRKTSVICVGLLVAGGLAIAAPAYAAASTSGSKSCTSTKQPYLTTTRGAGTVTTHTWTASGATTQVRTGTSAVFSSSFAGVSSGSYAALTDAASITVTSITCGPKAN